MRAGKRTPLFDMTGPRNVVKAAGLWIKAKATDKQLSPKTRVPAADPTEAAIAVRPTVFL